MELIGEVIFRVVAEVVLYNTGKIAAWAFAPGISVEPFAKQKSLTARQWLAFTYIRGQKRYFYTDTIQGLGLVVWLVLGGLLYGLFKILP